MKFLIPNYSCLQNPWLGGYRPQIPVLSVLCPQLNLLTPPAPRTKFLGTPLFVKTYLIILLPEQSEISWLALWLKSTSVSLFLYQITAASRTPDYGTTAPRSPFYLSSVLNWICWTPPNKIPGYATVREDYLIILLPKQSKIFWLA